MPKLEEGDVIQIKPHHKVYASLPRHFFDEPGNWETKHDHDVIAGNYPWLVGRYIVTKTSFEGGGPSYDGGYPNGHHVFCENVETKRIKVHFYQSGCFTAMIQPDDIEVVGKANKQWNFVNVNTKEDQ